LLLLAIKARIKKREDNSRRRNAVEGIIALLINLAIGAVGGNLAGAALKAKSLGYLWNSVVGVLGGGLGFFALGIIGAGGSGLIMQIIAAFVGGAALLFIVSLFRKAG
jgi:uncharacterized membrane protein YeaQ/YmgE (transglycosylase-associated protein family)